MDTRKLYTMAVDCLRHHGLEQQGWKVEWMREVTVMGRCKYGPRTIQLSRPLMQVNTEDECLDTVLHEIAHAICPVGGHGRAWQLHAISIGARPERCAIGSVKVPGKWQAICGFCGLRHDAYRRPKYNGRARCRCLRGRAWDPSQNLTFVEVR